MRSHHIPIAGAIIAYAISGCCGDQPDLCGQADLIIDAGVAAAPCWTAERAPLRTEASVSAPVGLQILGCARISEGDCASGAAGPSWGEYDLRHHAPAGVWVTTARGAGCPAEDCAITVGWAEAVIAARRVVGPDRSSRSRSSPTGETRGRSPSTRAQRAAARREVSGLARTGRSEEEGRAR